MTRPPPVPVRAPATMSSGVVGAAVRRPPRLPSLRGPTRTRKIGRTRSASQPLGTRVSQDGDPVGDEEQPDVGAGGLGPLRQERDDDAPVDGVQQVDRDRPSPGRAEREPEPATRDVGRAVVGGVVAGRSEAERHMPQDREAGDDRDQGDSGHAAGARSRPGPRARSAG